MIAFARYQFYWGGKQSDGASTSEHVDKAKDNCFASLVITDQTFADVPPQVQCPWELDHVWEFYVELDSTRQNSMTIGPITHNEISKWNELTQVEITPFEVKAIRAIDKAFIAYMNSKQKKDKT